MPNKNVGWKLEKEPSFLIDICHNFPHYCSPSQGIVEVLIGLVLLWFVCLFGLGDFFFPYYVFICSCVNSESAVLAFIDTCLIQQH